MPFSISRPGYGVFLIIVLSCFFIVVINRFIKKRVDSKVKSVLLKERLALHSEYLNYQKSVDEMHQKKLDAIARREADLSERESSINSAVRKKISETIIDISHRDYLALSPVFQSISREPSTDRLISSLRQQMKIVPPFNISANIVSSSGNLYEVTLYSCTCKDFIIRKSPCKHMFRLAAEVGALLAYDTSGLSTHVLSLLAQQESAQNELAYLDQQKKALGVVRNEIRSEREAIDLIAQENSQAYPWLASLYADYFDIINKNLEKYLREKRRPAHTAADKIQLLRKELKILQQQNKMNEYQLHFYESLFPWLEEFKELSPHDAFMSQSLVNSQAEIRNEYDTLKTWISPEEYTKLSQIEKYQLALDRYQSRHKTNWEIGIEYERYIGYCYEQRGYKVTYSGACFGLEDMGRDLILTKDFKYTVVQCKRWAQEKQIHEKHIFQLFGSCIHLELESPDMPVNGIFVTTATLSHTAHECAKRLGIQVFESVPYRPYPMIKCNIGHSGEKIYHLPFDQQYDRVVIQPEKGEFFASTILEAEDAGFRRALFHNLVSSQPS